MLERGRAHPIIGPILLIALVLVLAMVFLHAAHEGHGSATEVGVLCLAIVTLLGPLLLDGRRLRAPAPNIAARGDRGPPMRPLELSVRRPASLSAGWRALPLRR